MTEPRLCDLTKKDALLHLLGQGMIAIQLDPRRPGVMLPPHLIDQPVLRLNLSYAFQIPDLTIDDWGVSASLHFPNMGNVLCKVPWDALFGAASTVSQDGRMWVPSMPIELRRELAQRQLLLVSQARGKAPLVDLTSQPEPEPEAPRKGPHLQVIPGGSAEEPREEPPTAPDTGDAPPPEDPEDPPPKPRRSHLKLIKS